MTFNLKKVMDNNGSIKIYPLHLFHDRDIPILNRRFPALSYTAFFYLCIYNIKDTRL